MDRITKILGLIVAITIFIFWIGGWEKDSRIHMDPITIQGDPYACILDDCEECPDCFEDYDELNIWELLEVDENQS